MRVVLFGNGRVGLDTVNWFRQEGVELVGMVVHPDSSARLKNELLEASGLASDHIIEATDLGSERGIEKLRSFDGNIGISAYFAYILKSSVIGMFPAGIVNIHPAYLPYNRGRYPNVWSIVDATPAGVTIHYIDEGVDTGDIIAQTMIEVSPLDTGQTLHQKLEEESSKLLRATWPLIASGNAPRTPQDVSKATTHKAKDVENIDRIDLDQTYKARDLINIIRARTFPPFPGAFFEENGRRVYMRIELSIQE